MFINTTTIPTQMPEPVYSFFFYVCGLFSTGLIMGFSLVEYFLYKMRVQDEQLQGESDSESESESDVDQDDETAKYIEQYCDEFEALTVRELSKEELQSLNTKMVREQVSAGVEVIMTFDKTTDTFWYYTDQLKKVSYPILETVARKFMVDYDCKILRLQGEPQPAEGESEEKAPLSSETPQSIFAKFKKYNTGGKGSMPNFTSVVKVVEQMNHFRYRGKIYDYEETQKLSEKKEETVLDYASYKILCEKKEN